MTVKRSPFTSPPTHIHTLKARQLSPYHPPGAVITHNLVLLCEVEHALFIVHVVSEAATGHDVQGQS